MSRTVELSWRHAFKGERITVRAHPTDMPGIYAHRSVDITGGTVRQTKEWQLSTGQALYLIGHLPSLAEAKRIASLLPADVNWEHVTSEGWQRRKQRDPEFVRRVFLRVHAVSPS